MPKCGPSRHTMRIHSAPCDGVEPTSTWKSRADLQQVQLAHELAFNKLVDLLVDEGECEASCTEFRTANDSSGELSKGVLELIDDDVRLSSFSQADYFLRC